MVFDMNTIVEAVTSLKTAAEIIEKLKGLRGGADKGAEEKISELQRIILSAHSSALASQMGQFSMLQTVRELETKIAEFETWDSEKARYQMIDVNPGRGSVFVYALKEEANRAEPIHFICPKCYQHRKKSPLQATTVLKMRLRVHDCPECKSEFAFSYVPDPPARSAASTRYNPFDER